MNALSWLSPNVRAWLYRVALVVMPLLVAYGLLDGSKVTLWAALVGSVLVPGVAAVHTPTGAAAPDEPGGPVDESGAPYHPKHLDE